MPFPGPGVRHLILALQMKTRKITTTKLGLVYFILIVFLTCCNSRSKNLAACKLHYRNANAKLNSYYQNNNKSLLKEALIEINPATKCSETKLSAIEVKIGLLSLLHEYKNAYQFIDSLNDSDFKYKYKKLMDYNYFRALECESKSDIVNRDKFINKAKVAVQNYLDQEAASNDFNVEVYYDLFFVMSKTESIKKLDYEIDSLKTKHPKDSMYLEGMKIAILKLSKETNP